MCRGRQFVVGGATICQGCQIVGGVNLSWVCGCFRGCHFVVGRGRQFVGGKCFVNAPTAVCIFHLNTTSFFEFYECSLNVPAAVPQPLADVADTDFDRPFAPSVVFELVDEGIDITQHTATQSVHPSVCFEIFLFHLTSCHWLCSARKRSISSLW